MRSKFISALSLCCLIGAGTLISCDIEEIYTITIDNSKSEVILSSDVDSALAGATISINITYNVECEVLKVLVNDSLEATKTSDTLYTFTMPNEDVVVRATVTTEPTLESIEDAISLAYSASVSSWETEFRQYQSSSWSSTNFVRSFNITNHENSEEGTFLYQEYDTNSLNSDITYVYPADLYAIEEDGDIAVYEITDATDPSSNYMDLYSSNRFLNAGNILQTYYLAYDEVLSYIENVPFAYEYEEMYTLYYGYEFSGIEITNLTDTYIVSMSYGANASYMEAWQYWYPAEEYALDLTIEKETGYITEATYESRQYADGVYLEDATDDDLTYYTKASISITYGEPVSGEASVSDSIVSSANIYDGRSDEGSISTLTQGEYTENNVTDAYNILNEYYLYGAEATSVDISGEYDSYTLSAYMGTYTGEATASGTVTLYEEDILEEKLSIITTSTEEDDYEYRLQHYIEDGFVIQGTELISSSGEETISKYSTLGRSMTNPKDYLNVAYVLSIASISGVSASLRENGGFGNFNQGFGPIDVYFYEGHANGGDIYLDVGYDYNVSIGEWYSSRIIYRVKITIEDYKLVSIWSYESNDGDESTVTYSFNYGELGEFSGELI